jgi:hypothetical protein
MSQKWLCNNSDLEKWYGKVIPFDAVPEGAEEIKRSRSRLVVRMPGPDGHPVYIKRYKIRTTVRQYASLLHHSKSRREISVHQAAEQQGIPVAPVVLGLDIRHNGILRESYLVQKEIPEAVAIQDWIISENFDPDMLIPKLARFLVDVQQKGFYHDDLRTDHILLRWKEKNHPEFFLIDLDNARLHNGPLGFEDIVNNLVQLNRSLFDTPLHPWLLLQFLREFTRVHPRLESRHPGPLWRRISFFSGLRKARPNPMRETWYRLQYEMTGDIPEPIKKILKT